MSTTLERLKRERAEIDAAIERESGKEEARKKLRAQAEKLGYSIEELFLSNDDEHQTKQRRPKAKPKYRDPENHRKSWAGEDSGRPMPDWLREKLDAGHKLEEFLIED
ncbi:H-NS histone family protein [Ruegeria sp. HKCCD6228]|uniref:H-NS histone family protein n=1 Tax=Ruegeria sp. HKCCD6228 TaxID=2683001 RepID=UPI001491F0E8|nr:H-NS histone family protein [Ruegeria sp. HKCCD6228]NOD96902.1 H-NS histone family protein [Ruegeria sp. HKCCD6228]